MNGLTLLSAGLEIQAGKILSINILNPGARGGSSSAPFFQGSDSFIRGSRGETAAAESGNGVLGAGCRCGRCISCAAQVYKVQENSVPQASSGSRPEIQEAGESLPAGEEDASRPNAPGPKGADGEALSREELAQLNELKKRDRIVRAHEQAHMAAAAGLVTRGMSFSYQKGPDGKSYAVGGEVQIDAGKASTPSETIAKMRKVRAAALAPADPSSQDRRVAAGAMTRMAQARMELRVEQVEETKEQRGAETAAEGAGVSSAGSNGETGDDKGTALQAPVLLRRNMAAYGFSRKTDPAVSRFHLEV